MEITNETASLQKGIRRLLSIHPELGAPRRIVDVEKLYLGMEADVWSFAVETGGDEEERVDRYVLKLFARSDAPRASEEMFGLETIRSIGVRCPRPIAASEELAVFGRPYVLMERIAGPSVKQIFYETRNTDRDAALDIFCQVFVELHRADWRPAKDRLMAWDEDDPYGYMIVTLCRVLERIKEAGCPGLIPVWNWLGERLYTVPCRRPALLHNDFHPGNVLLPPDGPPVIIDWGGADVGDPRRELAWSLLNVGAYETEARDRILREYSRRSGEVFEQFEYFEVLACLTRILSLAESWEYFLDRYRARKQEEMEVTKLRAHLLGVRTLLDGHTGIHVPELDRISESLALAVH
jgi:aminoglycoside phosphotransferase (APT) family kinase protein